MNKRIIILVLLLVILASNFAGTSFAAEEVSSLRIGVIMVNSGR